MVGETEEQAGHKPQLVLLKMKVSPCVCVFIDCDQHKLCRGRIHAASCVKNRLLVEVGRKWLCNHPAEIQPAPLAACSQ